MCIIQRRNYSANHTGGEFDIPDIYWPDEKKFVHGLQREMKMSRHCLEDRAGTAVSDLCHNLITTHIPTNFNYFTETTLLKFFTVGFEVFNKYDKHN